MHSVRFLLVPANPALAVVEVETPRPSPIHDFLRPVFGALAIRMIYCEGCVVDGAIHVRIYVSNVDGSPVTAARVRQMHAQACQALGRELTHATPQHSLSAVGC